MNKSCFSVLVVLLTILTVSDASAGEAIYACAQKNSGDLRIVPAPGQCRNSEYEVTWTSGDQSQQRINELLGRVAALEGALGVINEAPVVDAGSDQTLLVSMVLYSDASVTDDGLMLPLTYGFDAVRGWLLKTDTLLPLPTEVALLIVFMFVMLWFGAWVFYKVEKRVRMLGTLGQH